MALDRKKANKLLFKETKPGEPGQPPTTREYNLSFRDFVCSQESPVFGVGNLEDGKVAAFWENHAQVFENVEELRAAGVLNIAELGLLDNSVHK